MYRNGRDKNMGDNQFQILLSAFLNEQKSIDNINSQIKKIEQGLKSVSISLNLGDFKAELEKVFGQVESSVKKVSNQKLEFGSVADTKANIKELSGNLDSIYAQLKSLGQIKSLNQLYDNKGGLAGFSVQLESVKNGLREIQNYNVVGNLVTKTDEETKKVVQSYEYALQRVSSVTKEMTQKQKDMVNATKSDNGERSYYNGLIEQVHKYKLELISVDEFVRQMKTRMYSGNTDNGFAGQFNNRLTSQEQEKFVALLRQAREEQKRNADDALRSATTQEVAIKRLQNALSNSNTKYSKFVDEGQSNVIKTMVSDLAKLNPQTVEYATTVKKVQLAVAEYTKALQTNAQAQKQADKETDQRKIAYNSQILAVERLQNALNNTNTKYSTGVDQSKSSELQNLIYSLSMLNPLTADYTVKLAQLQQAMGTYVVSTRESATASDRESKAMTDKAIAIDKIQQKLNTMTGKYGSFVDPTQLANINAMIASLQQMNPLSTDYRNMLKNIGWETSKLGTQSQEAFRRSQDAISDTTAKTSALGLAMRTLGQLFMIGSPIFLARRVFTDITTSINEMNKAMTDAMLITGMTNDRASDLVNTYNRIGKELGVSTKQVSEGGTEWLRAGKTIAETEELIKASTMGAKLAGIETAEMTQYLTSALNGYKLEAKDAIDVVSKMVAIDNSASTSVNELAVAMSRTATSAQMVGVSMDELLGYIGTVSSVSRKSSETIGESFKTMFARFQNLKMGDFVDEDGMVSSDVKTALSTVGIELMKSETEFRNFGEVIDELSGKWDTLTQAQKSMVSSAMAGTRQRENFLILMENMGKATDLTTKSMESAGLAQSRYGTYVESTEAKLGKLKASLDAVYLETINSSTINNLIDLGTATFNLIESVGGLDNVLGLLLSTMILIKSQAVTTFITSIGSSFAKLGTSLVMLKSNLAGMIMQLRGVQTVTTMTAGTLSSLVPIIGAVGLAISTGVMLYNSWEQAQRKKIETAKEQNEEMRKEQQGIDDVMLSYAKLKDANKNDTKVRKELLDLQKKMGEQLGSEVVQVDLLNKSYEQNVSVLEKVFDRRNRLYKLNQKMIVADTQKEIKDALSKGVDGKDFGNDKEGAIISSIVSSIPDNLQKNIELLFGSKKFTLKFNADIDEAELMATLDSVISQLESYGYENTDIYRELLGYQETMSKNYDAMAEAQKSQKQAFVDTAINSAKAKAGVEDLTTATKAQYEAMKKIITANIMNNGANGNTEQRLNMVRETMLVLEGQMSHLFKTPQQSLEDTMMSIEQVQESMKDYADDLDTLNSAIENVKKGQQLSGEEIVELTRKYPQLASQVKNVNGVYSLELESLTDVKNARITEQKAMIQVEMNKTKELLKQSGIRLEAYGIEMDMLNTMEGIQNAKNKLMQGNPKDRDVIALGGYVPPTKGELNEQEKGVVGYLDRLAQLQQEYNNSDILAQGDKEKDKKSKLPKYISQGYDDAIKEIMSKGDELARQIEITQKKIEQAQAKGDIKTELSLRGDLESYYESQKQVQHEMANKLRELRASLIKELSSKGITEMAGVKLDGLTEKALGDYTRQIDAEIDKANVANNDKLANDLGIKKSMIQEYGQAIIETNNQINSLGSGWWDSANNKDNAITETIQRQYELEKKVSEDRIRTIEQEQSLYESNSREYIALEEQKQLEKIKLQDETMKAINELRKRGFDDEKDEIKALKDEWYGYKSDVIAQYKAINDAKRDLLQQDTDNITKLQDLVINMLKQQQEEVKKTANKEKDALKEKLDGFKKIIDARKDELRKIKEQHDYEKSIEKSNKNMEDIQSQIAVLKFDDSSEGIQKRLELEGQLADLKDERAELEFDAEIKRQEDILDGMAKSYEEMIKLQTEAIDRELKALEEKYKTEAMWRAEANKLIENDNGTLMKKLIEWNNVYGSGIKQEIVSAWEDAQESMANYDIKANGVLTTLNEIAVVMRDLNVLNKNMTNASIGTIPNISTQTAEKIANPDIKESITSNINSLGGTNLLAQLPVAIASGLSGVLSSIKTDNNTTLNFEKLIDLTVQGNMDSTTVGQVQGMISNAVTQVFKTIDNSIRGKGSYRNATGFGV